MYTTPKPYVHASHWSCVHDKRHMHMRTSMHGARMSRERARNDGHLHVHGARLWGTCMCMLMDTAGMCWWSV